MIYATKRWLKFILLFSSFPCFAAFCPNNFNQINAGDTLERVIQQCGKPDSQNETKKTDENVPQEWSFYIPQTVSTNNRQSTQGTLKTQMTFDANGKVSNISVNGIGVGSSTICGGKNISLSDSRDQVQAACGNPNFVNKQNPSAAGGTPEQKQTTTTTFIYNTNPPAKLIFENGQLKGQ